LRYCDTEPAEGWRSSLYRIARNLLNEHYRRFQSRREQQAWLRETMPGRKLPIRFRFTLMLTAMCSIGGMNVPMNRAGVPCSLSFSNRVIFEPKHHYYCDLLVVVITSAPRTDAVHGTRHLVRRQRLGVTLWFSA
jgi:hypothetical protein